jgi:hypothetical protein
MSDHSHILAIVACLGLTVSSVFVPFSVSRNAKPGARARDMSLNWKVTVKRANRDVLTCDYGAGIAHAPSYQAKCHGAPHVMTTYRDDALRAECETGRAHDRSGSIAFIKGGRALEPKALDVLYSLINDASVLDHGSFESWAGDYGYDTDSRSAEATYRACLAHALALRNAIGEAGLSELQEAFQDY